MTQPNSAPLQGIQVQIQASLNQIPTFLGEANAQLNQCLASLKDALNQQEQVLQLLPQTFGVAGLLGAQAPVEEADEQNTLSSQQTAQNMLQSVYAVLNAQVPILAEATQAQQTVEANQTVADGSV